MKKKRFYRFDCIFKAQKHDCNKKKYFGCLEETCPYLRKPTPRKILYLNPLTHMYAPNFNLCCSSNINRLHRHIRCSQSWHGNTACPSEVLDQCKYTNGWSMLWWLEKPSVSNCNARRYIALRSRLSPSDTGPAHLRPYFLNHNQCSRQVSHTYVASNLLSVASIMNGKYGEFGWPWITQVHT